MGTTPNDLTTLVASCADYHEAGLRAHLAGGPTDRQEIVDEVHAYVAEMIDDCDPCYQPTCDLQIDRLAESGDLPADPMANALAPFRAAITDERCNAAMNLVHLTYSAAFPNDVPHDDWELSDALDVLLDDGGALVTREVREAVRVVRSLMRSPNRSLDVFDAQGVQQVFAISPFGASETRAERLARWQTLGSYDPTCKQCEAIPAHPTLQPFQPSHKPGTYCQSGKRPHCTCPTCWG